MVLSFIPAGNDSSNPCSGLELWNASRPEPGPLFTVLGCIFFAVYMLSACALIVLLHRARNAPRFVKIRPFSLSLFSVGSTSFYVAAGTIMVALEAPFVCIMPFLIFGSTFIAATVVARLILLALETHYANVLSTTLVRRISKETNTTTDDDTSTSWESGGPATSELRLQWEACKTLFSITFGLQKVTDLEIGHTVRIKRRYHLFIFLNQIPCLLIPVALVFAVPPLYLCPASQATGVYMELMLGLLAADLFCIMAATKWILIAYKNFGIDGKGVLLELGVMVVVTGTTAGLVILLVSVHILSFIMWSVFFS
jgi:hypothetical protein